MQHCFFGETLNDGNQERPEDLEATPNGSSLLSVSND
jgi:hypothetical protein